MIQTSSKTARSRTAKIGYSEERTQLRKPVELVRERERERERRSTLQTSSNLAVALRVTAGVDPLVADEPERLGFVQLPDDLAPRVRQRDLQISRAEAPLEMASMIGESGRLNNAIHV